jgi:hypothetical protein
MDRSTAVMLSFFLLFVGAMAGGCSLVFSPFILSDPWSDFGLLIIWLAGLLIGGVALWGSVRLFRTGGR